MTMTSGRSTPAFHQCRTSYGVDDHMSREQMAFWYGSPDTKVGGEIRMVPLRTGSATPPSVSKEAESAELCWFCKSAQAEKDCPAHTDLYNEVRLADFQTTVTGYRITKRWDVIKVPVPRCRRCAKAHATRGKIETAFMLISGLAVVVAAVYAW